MVSDARFVRHDLAHSAPHAIEEMAECTQAIAKALRWGWHSVNPLLPEADQETNLAWVRREMKDTWDALLRLQRALDREFGEP